MNSQPLSRPWSRGEFAWEFLRRNRDYRRMVGSRLWARSEEVERRLAEPWGLRFIADPGLTAPGAPVFWRPTLAPGAVLELETARSTQPTFDLARAVIASRAAGEGLHLLLANGQQVLVRAHSLTGSMAAVLPLSGCFSAQLKAADALRRVMAGAPAATDDLAGQKRLRLTRALKAFDLHQASATYRQIATELFGASAIERDIWRTSSLRDVVIRLVRTGQGMVAGGYMRLLQAHEPAEASESAGS